MKSRLKKIVILFVVIVIFTTSDNYKAVALDTDIKDLGSKTITDINKVWKLSFNTELDIDSLHENIQIKDITNGNTFSPNLTQENNNSVVKISAPSGGYSIGHEYQLILKNNIKSKKGKGLSKTVIFNFVISSSKTEENSSNSSSNSSSTSAKKYNVSAKVIVSPVVPIFKQITIVSTNLPGAQKYKIEGNDNLISIGNSGVGVASGDSMKIHICDAEGNIIGTTDMNVSVTKEDISLLISK